MAVQGPQPPTVSGTRFEHSVGGSQATNISNAADYVCHGIWIWMGPVDNMNVELEDTFCLPFSFLLVDN